MSATGISLGSQTVSQNPNRQLFATPRKKLVLLGLALILGTLVLYQPLQSYGFINYDDPIYIRGNIPVQNGLAWKSIRWAFTTTAATNWHPITWLSHMLDVTL